MGPPQDRIGGVRKLAGDGGVLDSLGLVNLLVLTEQQLESKVGVSTMLVEEAGDASEEHFAMYRMIDELFQEQAAGFAPRADKP